MSLINQMLRDLEQRKKAAGGSPPAKTRPGSMERIPLLPRSLVLGALLLVLVFAAAWWLSGALTALFSGPGAPGTVAVDGGRGTPERETLTADERAAEAPAAVAGAEKPAEVPAESTTAPTAKVEPPAQTAPMPVAAPTAKAAPTAPVARKRPATAVKPAKVVKVVKVVKVSEGAQSSVPPERVVAPAPRRVNPDDLPGAVKSPPPAAEPAAQIDRPARVAATTPYGKAEEAFLDGRWALEQGRDALAIRSLQSALELYPGHLPARELLVKVLSGSGKSGEAMFLLAEGLEIAPDHMPFKKGYARLLIEQGDYEAASKVMLNGGLPSVDADAEAHVVMATLYQRLGEHFLAAQTYRNLLAVWPQTGAFWVGLGSALEGQELRSEAAECYRRGLSTRNLRPDLGSYARKRLAQLD